MSILLKLTRLLIVAFGIVSATFFIIRIGFEMNHTGIVKEYVDFLKGVIQMDFGISAATGQSVLSEILSRWPATIELGVIAIVLASVIGIPVGVIAANNERGLVDRCLIGVALIGYSMPAFWFALLLILLFSVGLDLTPVSGRLDIMYDVRPVTGFMMVDTLLGPVRAQYHFNAFYSAVSHLFLPTIVLASVPTAVFARTTRSSMLEILSKDYILSARAKGLSDARILLVHGLRNALTPILSVGGIHFISTVITGSIVVEVIFGWPGIGSYIIQSVYARDYSVVQVFLLSMGVLVLISNTLIDLILHLISHRDVRK